MADWFAPHLSCKHILTEFVHCAKAIAEISFGDNEKTSDLFF
jgi:hypothetical protein